MPPETICEQCGKTHHSWFVRCVECRYPKSECDLTKKDDTKGENDTEDDHVRIDTQYQKPEIKREGPMQFMFAATKKTQSKIACRQCSSCHGCR